MLGIISHLRAELDDPNNPLAIGIFSVSFHISLLSLNLLIYSDLSTCGSFVIDRLRNAITENDRLALDSLIELAYESLLSSESHRCWRRLFTDACLFRSLANFLRFPSPSEDILLESIARLDRAIIVAGPAGEGRRELIIIIIRKIQTQYLPLRHVQTDLKFLPSSMPPTQLETASECVLHLDSPPSLSSFPTYSQHPFILRGYAREWPAVQDHLWQSLDYLHSIAGPGRIVPVEVGND